MSNKILVLTNDDGTRWYKNGALHRVGGPAVEDADGTMEWYKNGAWHRVDGPAIEWADGAKGWWRNGKRHRRGGAAVEKADGSKEWWYMSRKIVLPVSITNAIGCVSTKRLVKFSVVQKMSRVAEDISTTKAVQELADLLYNLGLVDNVLVTSLCLEKDSRFKNIGIALTKHLAKSQVGRSGVKKRAGRGSAG